MTQDDLQGQERRITRRLLSFWHQCKDARDLPLESSLNPEHLDDIWDNCFIVAVQPEPNPEPYRYTYIGPSIIAAYGDTATGADIQTALISPSGHGITHIFDRAVESRKPVTEESEFLNLQKTLIRYRQCIIPFGNEKGEVTCLVGGMRWGVF